MNKPEKISVCIYESESLPPTKTRIEGISGYIITYQYYLDINFELNDEMKDKICKGIEEIIING